MIVLGINASHCATACLLRDGKIVSCISEERLTRIKNQSGLPVNAIKKVLEESGIKSKDLDKIAFSFQDMAINSGFAVLGNSENTAKSVYSYIWYFKEWLLATIPATRIFYPAFQKIFYNLFVFPRLKKELFRNVKKETGIEKEKIEFIDHHTSHAYSAYFGSPDYWKSKKLILTLDAMGDDLCATVSVGENGKIKRIAATSYGNSIGDLYAYVTRYLGMKMGEHEYKVMGMAPYASQKYVDKVYEKIKDWVWVNKNELTFGTKVFSHVFYKFLDKPFRNERFDNISGAIQKLTEKVIVDWVSASIKKTKISDVVCAGGVFMNVKANQKIMEMADVRNLFIFPSCGDESTAVGSAYYVYEKEKNKNKNLPGIKPITNLYWGLEYSDAYISKILKRKEFKHYKVERVGDMEKRIAKMISERKIVARFKGKMEWGARALGNRSILTHPQNMEGIRDINEQIKSRDFWMPFACSIILERMKKYLVNPKNINGPYMILAYNTNKEGAVKLRAAIHQYDFTARPQEVRREFNPDYYRLILEFEQLTGIGAVLNTSFNLHGYPIVCSPEDALYVFENSGLEYLALENYLVSKD
ncbi:MAG: Carbamoyl transferase [Candidatus Woesebacteria bacterium GW2011_GWA1_37_7]|uniref:Carbamoyl transferase n=1 Tax=Candidatus Woesebacteria bacterium GW2011_GWA1_37_7 TaxID=1618545 RepID=A0A0G0JHD2_9BACT|nr:MAG: Carbamoyl transferase [Candidatus Woesebacteria bacterium GW2011_GWA1_37_7]